MEFLLIVALVVAGATALTVIKAQVRRRKLMEKYADASVVDMIMKRMMWQGMSVEQLLDSLGKPAAIDQKIYKTKVAETYKYNQVGKNRFRNRVRVENGAVVGWEQK